MKQHITIAQINELSEKGKKRLRAWWKPQFHDKCIRKFAISELALWERDLIKIREIGEDAGWMESQYYDDDCDQEWKKDQRKEIYLPILSIGQLIEFLDEEYGAWCLESWQEWRITDQTNNVDKKLGESVELCDALFAAVKEILEHEK